jgi:glycosyltransferase involved in cell wall biosynthesis
MRVGAYVRPARVLIDGFFWGKPYGFGRFLSELCHALGSQPDPQMEFVVAIPSQIDLTTLPQYPSLAWQPVRAAQLPIWEQVLIPNAARRLACDVIHFPCNTHALFTGGRPAIVTIHDLMFLDEVVPWRRLKDAIYARYSRQIFRHASVRSTVIAVSDTTRRALVAHGVEARTVYNTADGFITAYAAVAPLQIPRPYILHRGGYAAHRNTKRVIEAFRAARAGLPGVDLKVLGTPDGRAVWQTEADRDIHFLPRVSDADLAALYRGSLCLVATSLREGFGLPILEGFGFGTPVITSDRDPMREVAGDAACLVDPTDVNAIADAMRAAGASAELRATLVARGTARARAFAATRVAAEMIAVYAEAAQHRKVSRRGLG